MKLPKPEHKKARIEIVPMIDTIFFLLVFFMITSLSMVTIHSKRVALPESETAKLKPKNQVTLTVDKDHVHYLDNQRVAVDSLEEQLRGIIEKAPDTQVVLNCDKSLPVTDFLQMFDLAKRSNAAHVMVATVPRVLKEVKA